MVTATTDNRRTQLYYAEQFPCRRGQRNRALHGIGRRLDLWHWRGGFDFCPVQLLVLLQ
jgi:hypothetical protein